MQALNTLTRRALLRVVTGGLTAFALAGTALLTGCGGTASDGSTASNGNNSGTGSTTSSGTTTGGMTSGTTSTGGTTTGTTTGGTTTGGTTTGSTGGGTGPSGLHLVASNASGATASRFNYDNSSTSATLIKGVLTIKAVLVNGSSSRTMQFAVYGGTLTAGLTYSFFYVKPQPGETSHGASLSYNESDSKTGSAFVWDSDAKTGTAFIDSVDGNHIRLHLMNVGMTPNPGYSGAAGTFTYDGTADVTVQ